MSTHLSNPVFFDAKQRRWRYSRRSIFSLVIFLFTLLGVLIGSIFIRPSLPILDLGQPSQNMRNAPKVPQSQAGVKVPVGFSTSSFDALVAEEQKKRVSIGDQSTNTNTKVLGFYVNWDDNSFTSLKQNIQKIDILVPEWIHLTDDDGNVTVDDQVRQDETIQFVRSNRADLPIVPLINNFNSDTQDWDSDRLKAVVSSPDARQALVENILRYIQANGFSGVSIDFESLPEGSEADLVFFMQELYSVLHPLGLQVSQNIPLDDPAFKPALLGQFSDYLILMAYDEHSIYDSQAGPVASQAWFTKAFSKCLQELPAEKYVVALGNYGYDWPEKSTTGTEMTFEDAITTAKESEGVVALDQASLNPTYSYYDDKDVVHHVWFLDAVSSFDEIFAAKKLGTPYGYALWRLGSEDPTLWNVFAHRDALDASTAESLQDLHYGYDVNYEGDGEILRVTDTPKGGNREVNFDVSSGFIRDEKITDFPSGYTVTRWGGTDKKKIALTFDDGPDGTYTPQILKILKQYNVPATFFVVGVSASLHPGILRQTVSDGNEVGNHTYTHPNITMISGEHFQMELDATERAFEAFLGVKSLLFRPPYAEDIEPATPDQVAPLEMINNLGYYTVGMHIDPSDWSRPGVDAIATSTVEQARSGVGNIVLLHDGGGNRDQTVAALPKIIEELQVAGFQLVTVSNLLGLSRESVMPPVGTRERFVALSDRIAFFSITGFSYFLSTMFLIGIILGIIRFLFIGILAVTQYFYARFGKYKRSLKKFTPQVAVIIPAYNEEVVIIRTVLSILISEYPHMRVIVVDDGSTDRTLQRLKQEFENDSHVTILTQENAGKAEAINFGIRHTDSADEIIVVLDADTIFCPDTITKLIRRFVDKRIGAVAGNAKVGNRLNILTRWQALEYITSQNLDRRAFELINCISVVPGAVGAWRRQAVLEAGGFSKDTLAEDADLTFAILRRGYRIAYDDEALAYTEAPETVGAFVKQRFRWMFGTLQTAWKHKDTLFHLRYGSLGFFAVPNVFIFQVFFPLISPFMDMTLILSLFWAIWQKYQHPVGYTFGPTTQGLIQYYILFLIIDFVTASLPFFLEHKEEKSLLLLLPLQRFFYRQLMYYVAIKTTTAAIKGKLARWGKLDRKATVKIMN